MLMMRSVIKLINGYVMLSF